LERVARRHRRERRRTLAAVVAIAMLAGACSGSSDEPAPSAEPATTPAPSTRALPTTTPGSVPPTITTNTVPDTPGRTVTAVDGDGPATFAIPAAVGVPAIVHAQYDGAASFVVTALDARGEQIGVLASSLGAYDGTFPVGFVEASAFPTAQLHVETTGRWHLDLADPALAPELTAPGVSGTGDAVLAYTGPPRTARFSFAGSAPFRVDTYSRGQVTIVARAVGPHEGDIALPAGPAFVSVTAGGDWSIRLGAATR
jgi:hypothetical protein